MTPQDKHNLRLLRDDTESPEDKRLLRRALDHIYSLEGRISAIRTLTRAITNETKYAPDNTNEGQD